MAPVLTAVRSFVKGTTNSTLRQFKAFADDLDHEFTHALQHRQLSPVEPPAPHLGAAAFGLVLVLAISMLAFGVFIVRNLAEGNKGKILRGARREIAHLRQVPGALTVLRDLALPRLPWATSRNPRGNRVQLCPESGNLQEQLRDVAE